MNIDTNEASITYHMTEEERLRRRKLRRRPRMLKKAEEYGLLHDADDNWTLVTQKGRKM